MLAMRRPNLASLAQTEALSGYGRRTYDIGAGSVTTRPAPRVPNDCPLDTPILLLPCWSPLHHRAPDLDRVTVACEQRLERPRGAAVRVLEDPRPARRRLELGARAALDRVAVG